MLERIVRGALHYVSIYDHRQRIRIPALYRATNIAHRALPTGPEDESLGVVINHSSFGKQSFVHRRNLGAVHIVLKDTA
jgi:hypothetical protein